jgi:hypothetical protein
MLNREKFLNMIGYDSHWSSDNPGIITWSTEQEELSNINPLFIDMLCDMVDIVFKFYTSVCPSTKKLCSLCSKEKICVEAKCLITIEKATGKTWEELLKIIEECQE